MPQPVAKLERRISDEKRAREPGVARTCKLIALRVAPASPPEKGLAAVFGTRVNAGLLTRGRVILAASLFAGLRSGGVPWRRCSTGKST